MTNERYAYLLIVEEEYWDILIQRAEGPSTTQAFVRRSRVGPLKVEKLLFYVTKKRKVLGFANFMDRQTGNPESLWRAYGAETCFGSVEEYQKFVDGRLNVAFIRFNDLQRIANPRTREEVAEILGPMRGFGAGRYLDEETASQLL